jgi:predicted phage tail protein
VALVSAESTDTKIGDDTYLEYVESIIYDDFSFPGSTVFALRALATDKLSGGMPVISMIATRSTVPVWTGAAYENLPADNPAWASYDVLHDSNYGGGVDHSRIVYSDFLKWANNCDLHYISVGVASPVSFKCNYYVDAGTSVRKILNDLGVLGRGNTVQMGSYFTCFVDKLESLPAQSFLFNMGNIEAKSFSIEYMEMESRANAVDVTFWDKDNNYDQKTLEIHASDFDATTTEIKKTQITLRGCTTRAEALAHGNFAMNNNRLLTTTANWSADIDAIGCLPWDVVEAQHDHTLWGDGGLVVSGTTDTVVLDKELTLAADTTYTLNIQSIATDEIKQYTLATLQEETTTAAMVITTTFDPIPTEHDKWTISTVGVSTKLFRLMRTTRMDDLTRKLVCLEYNPDIYDDSGALDAPEVPVLPTYEAHLQAREIQKWNGSPDTEIQLSWTGFALRWHVFWKKASGVLGESNWRYAGATMEPMLRIPSLDQQADVYTFCVSHTQNPADGITVDLAVTGTAIIAIPGTPVNLTAAIRGQVIVLQWNAATDVSVTGYTVYLNGSAITTNFAGTVYIYAQPLTAGVYNFTLAAVNRGGASTPTDAASITVAVPATPSPSAVIVGEQVVVTWEDCETTLPIAYYKINAVKQGKSTRYLDRINWVGAKDYGIIAVDVAGNQSAEGTTSITVTGLTAITGIIATGHTYNIRLDLTYETFDEFETVEIWSNTINNRTGAVKVGETAATAWTHSGLSLIDTRYYWTRTRNTFGTVGTWYPVSATAGIVCSTSTEPSDYLNALAGKLSESELTATLSNRIDWIDTEEFVLDVDIIEPNIMNGLNGAFCGLSDVQAVHKASIDSLLSSTVATALDVMGLQAEVASLTTTDWSATGDYILGKYVIHGGEAYRCLIAYTYAIDGTKTPGVDTTYWEPADALATIVSDIDMRVDDLEGEIVNKVSTTTFNALDNRVIAAESTVAQNSGDILLRVTQSDFDALGNLFIPDFNANSEYVVNDYVKHLGVSYVCIEEIDFTPAPTPAVTAGWETYWEVAVFSDRFSTVINQVDVNTNGISLASEAITGDLALVVDIVEHGTVVEDAGDVEDLDIRIMQAGIEIDGVQADILLHTSLISGIDNRLSQAEIDIDGANAAIALKASQSSLNDATADITAAEILINGHTASIALNTASITTLISTTGGHTTQINQALIDIDAAEAAILLRASKTEIDGLIAPVYSATTLYNTGNQVRYNYSGTLWRLYQCKNNNTVGHAPTETSYWTVVSALASRVSTAETSITAGEAGTWTSISNKVLTDTYDSDQKVNGVLRITTAEQNIGALQSADGTLQSNIDQKVAITTYDSDQKVNGVLKITTAESRLSVIDNPTTGTVAALTSRMTAIDASSTGRMAVAESTLSATVDDVGDVKAQYTVKLNVNNRVAGFGLMLSEDTPSEFVVVAEKFQVVDNSDALNPKQVFTIGNINGVSAVGINGDLIIDGSILARNIGANEIIANSANIKDAVITNAKIANATIEGAKIKDATITSAKIGTIEASKITAGTIGAQTIYLGDSHVVLDGVNKCIRVYDENNVLRVELGLLS